MCKIFFCSFFVYFRACRAGNTFRAASRPREHFRNSRLVIPNRLDEPDTIALTKASETVNSGLKYVSGHNSAQRAFRKLLWGDSESSLRALRNGVNGAFGATFGHFCRKIKGAWVQGCGAPNPYPIKILLGARFHRQNRPEHALFRDQTGSPGVARGPIHILI